MRFYCEASKDWSDPADDNLEDIGGRDAPYHVSYHLNDTKAVLSVTV
jgi:hypothetical protein